MNEEKPILIMKDISKTFPGVKALSGVDFRMFKGEVHAIMGQNGAGKSTLIKVLTGVHPIDKGSILVEGKNFSVRSPLEAQREGISTVYQEVNLCPNLTVAENIFIGHQPLKFGFIDWATMKKKSEEVLSRLNLSIDVTQLLSDYSVAIQQMVAIARVLNMSSKILILDEPTSSLDEKEVRELFAVLKKLKSEGLAILFVTHFLDQTYEISDRITVLRNGQLIGEYRTENLSRVDLISKMMGKEITELQRITKGEVKAGNGKAANHEIELVSAKGIGRKGAMNPFDLRINKGEVVGLAGLLGSGRTESARIIFGIDKADSGDVSVNGTKRSISSPRDAIDAGMGFCPEDRKSEGIVDELTVRENIILALQGRQGILDYLPKKKQLEIANEYIRTLGIKTPDADKEVRTLSGGNQQKVLLARWLATKPKLLILDEPTRGIDVGAKVEIQELVTSLCKEGMAILFISSELEEVVRVSNRVAVLRDRQKVSEIEGDEINEQTIMHTIAGGHEC
ncbi:MAG TPA: sugar ABC transporter ATP-binding protein [Spirochaetota bacterium]